MQNSQVSLPPGLKIKEMSFFDDSRSMISKIFEGQKPLHQCEACLRKRRQIEEAMTLLSQQDTILQLKKLLSQNRLQEQLQKNQLILAISLETKQISRELVQTCIKYGFLLKRLSDVEQSAVNLLEAERRKWSEDVLQLKKQVEVREYQLQQYEKTTALIQRESQKLVGLVVCKLMQVQKQ